MNLAEMHFLSQRWRWLGRMFEGLFRAARPRNRQLRLAEVLPLGERRFVALVECDQRRFLIGSTPQSIRLLTEIRNRDSVHRLIGGSRREHERTQ
jgi:flagellar biogenesis protein FliO